MQTYGDSKNPKKYYSKEFHGKLIYLTGIFVFLLLAILSTILIDGIYQTTLDKYREHLREVLDIKVGTIEIIKNNWDKYSDIESEQAFLDLLYSEKSLYGVGSLVSVVYLSKTENDLIYIFHHKKGDEYPTVNIRKQSALDTHSQAILQNHSGILDGVNYLGTNVIGYYSKLENLNWTIFAKINYKDIQTPFIGFILIIIAITIICFSLSCFAFRYFYQSSIKKIRNVAKRTNELMITSSHVIYTIDHKTHQPTFISENVKYLIGYEVDEIVRENNFWAHHVHPGDFYKVRLGMSKLAEGRKVVFEYRFRNKQGEYIWLQDTKRILNDKSGKTTEVVGSWAEVTHLKKAEEEVKAQKEYSENLLQNLATPTFIIDPKHKVLFWNKACEELTGLSASNVVGTNKHWRGFYQIERPCLVDVYIDNLDADEMYSKTESPESSEGSLHAENWCSMYNGKRLYLSIHVGPIFDNEGELVAVVENLRDLTEHRNLEIELMSARDKALEAVNTKGQFLANMSHEIRTPMNGVLGMLDQIKQTELTEIQRDLTDTAFHSAESLLDIINEILDFSKIDAGKLQIEIVKFDLHGLLDDIGRLFKFKADEKSIEFKMEIGKELPKYVFGDPTRLRQILINFLGNAIKFTEKGYVILRAMALHKTGNKVDIQFDIDDSGIGIASSKMDSLFDEFGQVDASTTRNFGGTGLGLAISKKIIDLLNGRIRIQSELGHGSCFSVFISFEAIDAIEDTVTVDNVVAFPRKDNSSLSEFSHLNILLVEDNRVNQKVALGILKKFSLISDLADNGEIAVKKVKQGNYHLLLMDCQMPVMNGYDATRQIRIFEEEEGRDRIPIIAMTANAMQGDMEKCLAAGMDDYLSKPIDKSLLEDKLYQWLSEKDLNRKEN